MSTKRAWEKRSKKYGDDIRGVLPKSFPKASNSYLDKWMYEQVKKSFVRNKKQAVLDIGCGYGRLSEKILRDFPKAKTIGVDISKEYIKLYNNKLKPRGRGIVADIRKLPLPTNSVDIVIMVTTLMYMTRIKDQKRVMSEIARVLRPKGKFVIIERNHLGYRLITLGGLVDKLRGEKNKEITAVSFSAKTMSKLLESSGLKTEFISGVPFWTMSLPLVMLVSKVSEREGGLITDCAAFSDERFRSATGLSMYIAYSGLKD